MSPAVRKVAFVCLPDNQLDIFSAVTRNPAYRAELVINYNENAFSYKMADILQLPTSSDPTMLLRFPCSVIVIPNDRPDLKIEMAQYAGDPPAVIMTVDEMAAELGLDLSAPSPESAADAATNWGVLLDLRPGDESPEGGAPASEAIPERYAGPSGFLVEDWTIPQAPVAGDPGAGPPKLDAVETVLPVSLEGADSPASEPWTGDDSPAPPPAPEPKSAEPKSAESKSPEPKSAEPKSPEPKSPEPAAAEEPPRGMALDSVKATLETLSLAFDKRLLLRRILEIAVSAAGGESGSIMLLEPDAEYLRIAVADGLSDDVVRRTRQRIGEGVAGGVLLEGRARILVDKLNDPRYRKGRERSEIKAAVCVPIRAGNRAIGVLNVSSDRRIDSFNQRSVELLEKFGQEVAFVLMRAMELSPSVEPRELEETLARQINALMSIDKPLSGRLQAVAEKLADLLGAFACRVYLLDGTGRRLETAGSFTRGSTEAGRITLTAADGIPGWVLQHGQPEAFYSALNPAEKRAILYFPLRSGALSLGLVEFESVPVESAGPDELFQAAAKAVTSLAEVIQRDRSSQALARRSRLLLNLSDLAVELMADREFRDLIDLAAQNAADLFGAGLAILRARAPDEAEDTVAFSDPNFGVHPDAATQSLLQFEEDLSARLPDEAVALTDTALPAPIRDHLGRISSIRWLVTLPLRSPAGRIGGLTLFGMSDHAPRLDGEDLQLLERLGTYITKALGRSLRGSTASVPGSESSFMRWSHFQDRVAEEIKRTERYGRPFSVTTIELNGLAAAAETRGRAWREGALKALADFLRAHVREVDIPAWVRDGRVAILSPEANPEGAPMAQRLEEEWGRYLEMSPVDGLSDIRPRMEEFRYPRDTRDPREFLDLVAGRFDGEIGEESRRVG